MPAALVTETVLIVSGFRTVGKDAWKPMRCGGQSRLVPSGPMVLVAVPVHVL